MKRAILLVALSACGDNFDQPGVIMDVSDTAPAYGRAPFPNDAVRDGAHLGTIAGLDAIAHGNSDLVAAHLAGLDGWGLRPTVEFFVDGSQLDPATVLAQTTLLTDPIIVIDLVTGMPVAMDWRYDATRNVIAGSPSLGTILLENEQYAAVITSDVHGLDGSPIYGGVGLGALSEQVPARWASTATTYAALSQTSALAGRIQGIAVFTTQAASSVLVAARNALPGSPAAILAFDDPTVIFDTPAKLDALLGQATRDTAGPRVGLEQWGTDNPTGIAHDHVAVIATGTMTTVRFRQLDTASEGPESGTFVLGPDGVPIVQAIDPIPITIVLPKTPPQGTVIFGHGLGGSRADMMNLAEPLTSEGYAIIAIDMWGHGSRYDPTDVTNNFADRPGFTGDRMLHDGFGDATGYAEYIAFFENFENVSAVRDSIRQSAIDFARVATLIQLAPDLSALAAPFGGVTPKLPLQVAYLGESFGTLVGTDLAAIEPSVAEYVLDVPGGGILDQIVPASGELGELALPLMEEIYRTDGTLDRFHPLIGAMQAVLDGGDPLTFAPHVLHDQLTIANKPISGRHVLCIEAMTDEIMASAGTTALARALGLAVLEPNLHPPAGLQQLSGPGSVSFDDQNGILVQYEPATHGLNWSSLHGQLTYVPGYPFAGSEPYPKLAVPIAITEPIYATQAQVAQFLSSGLITSTQTPIADFDGDGVPDDRDPYPFDPTR